MPNVMSARSSLEDTLDIGLREKRSKHQHIIEKGELDLQKANNVQVAARLRSHKSITKLKFKKPK